MRMEVSLRSMQVACGDPVVSGKSVPTAYARSAGPAAPDNGKRRKPTPVYSSEDESQLQGRSGYVSIEPCP